MGISMMKRLLLGSFLFASCALVGCGASPIEPAVAPCDAPVSASEPRAQLALRVDLRVAQDCEEAFDLALYRNRAVELIQWDAKKGVCEGRVVQIRYLSSRLKESDLQREVASLAERISPAVSQPALNAQSK
jgi:hypothetical protein